MAGAIEVDFPHDENGDVLRRMAAHGDDLSVSREVDFEHIFPSIEGVTAFVGKVATRTDSIHIDWFAKKACWNVRVSRDMVPTHAGITALELSLDKVAREHGGKADGWGCAQA